MKNKLLTNNWIRSIAINAIILCTTVLTTRMLYETNDDYAIASRLADGYPYVGFVNYYLCKLIISVQRVMPHWNCYVIFLVAISFIAMVCIMRTIFEAGNNKFVSLITVATLAIFSIDHYCSIQFTKTAALVMLSGLLLLVDTIINKKKLPYYILSIALVYVGASIRVDALIGVIGFTGIFVIYWILLNRKTVLEDGYFTKKRIVTYLVLILLVFGGYGFDKLSCEKNVETDALRYAEDYSLYRSNIVDYPTYKYYDENKEKYDAIGISENDIYLISHWVFDYDGAASFENLQAIDDIERTDDSRAVVLYKATKKCARDIIKSMRKFSFTGIHIFMMMLIALLMLITTDRRHWLFPIFIGIMTLCLYIAIYYMQRPNYRALYVADISACVWMLYYLMKNGKMKAKWSYLGVLLAILLMIIPVGRAYTVNMYAAENKVMSEETENYFKNKDCLYVWNTKEKQYSSKYINPLLSPKDSEKNICSTGGWGVLSPYVLNKLAKFNVTNPVRNLITKDNIYYVGNKNIKRLEEYFNKWYSSNGQEYVFVKHDYVDGVNIWQVKKR